MLKKNQDALNKKINAEFKERLLFLEEYLNSRYSPLKAETFVSNVEDRPYSRVRVQLVGENGWSLGVEVYVATMYSGTTYTYAIEQYIQEIKNKIQDGITKEGIKSINS